MIGNTSAFKGYPSGDICVLLFIQNITPFLAGFIPRLIFHNQLALTKFGRSVDCTIIDVIYSDVNDCILPYTIIDVTQKSSTLA